jgi:hypothetical protein
MSFEKPAGLGTSLFVEKLFAQEFNVALIADFCDPW